MDSDDEHERRPRGRDKFRRERSDYNDRSGRRDDRSSRREDEGLCGIQGVRIIEILIATEGTAEEDIMIK